MTNPVKKAARTTRNNSVVHFFARLGYAVNGLLHGLIGAIAIGLALGAGSGQADQSGALAAVAATPGGVFVLWAIVVGLVALGLWLIVSSFLTAPSDGKKKAAHYLSEIGKGVAYLAVAATALTFAEGGSSNSASATTSLSATLLSTPGGVFVVVLIGLGIICIGGYFVVKGATRRFKRDLSLPSGAAGRATVALGVFGYVSKGIVLGVVGILFCVAAATTDPAKSTGLDGGLKTLATLPFGVFILVVIGIGLIAYGVYSLVRARYAHL